MSAHLKKVSFCVWVDKFKSAQCPCWVPKILIEKHKTSRLQIYTQLKSRLDCEGESFLGWILSCDEVCTDLGTSLWIWIKIE